MGQVSLLGLLPLLLVTKSQQSQRLIMAHDRIHELQLLLKPWARRSALSPWRLLERRLETYGFCPRDRHVGLIEAGYVASNVKP